MHSTRSPSVAKLTNKLLSTLYNSPTLAPDSVDDNNEKERYPCLFFSLSRLHTQSIQSPKREHLIGKRLSAIYDQPRIV